MSQLFRQMVHNRANTIFSDDSSRMDCDTSDRIDEDHDVQMTGCGPGETTPCPPLLYAPRPRGASYSPLSEADPSRAAEARAAPTTRSKSAAQSRAQPSTEYQDHWSTQLANSLIGPKAIAYAYISHLKPWTPCPDSIPLVLRNAALGLNSSGQSITNIYFGLLKALLYHFAVIDNHGNTEASQALFHETMLRSSFLAASDNLWKRLRSVVTKYNTILQSYGDSTEPAADLMLFFYSRELEQLALATWYMWQWVNHARASDKLTFMETTKPDELRDIWSVMDAFGGAFVNDGFERGSIFRYACGLDPALWETMVTAKGNDPAMELLVRKVTVEKGFIDRPQFQLSILRAVCELAGLDFEHILKHKK